MSIHSICSNEILGEMAKARFVEERRLTRLDGWFIAKEIQRECDQKFAGQALAVKAANRMREIAIRIPISISEYLIFAETQDNAFARSYALIKLSRDFKLI